MAENLAEFTDADWESNVVKSDVPVLVDFWAPGCGPCKVLLPTIEELATEYAGRVRVGKMNTQSNLQTAMGQQIRGVPTVILFKGGEPVERFMGLPPKEKLVEAIDQHLN